MTPEGSAENHRPAEFLTWVRQVDAIMKRDWLVNTSDAGLGDEDVLRYWAQGEAPEIFVAWFAEKYDLVRPENPWQPSVSASSST